MNTSSKWFETRLGTAPQVAWINEDGTAVDRAVLAQRIRVEHPALVGAHISAQNRALGLECLFETGTTPAQLPWSWA